MEETPGMLVRMAKRSERPASASTISRMAAVDFGFNVGLEDSPEEFSVSIGTGT
jgi:hypothetical protein